MCIIAQTPKRIKCSNRRCDYVFTIVDNLYYVNDPGFVIKRCPKCGVEVRVFVNNTDDFKQHPDTVRVCDCDDCDNSILSIPEGKQLVDKSIIKKIPNWSPEQWQEIWKSKGVNRAFPCDNRVEKRIEEISQQLFCAYNAHMAGQLYIRDPKWIMMKVSEPYKLTKYALYAKPIHIPEDISSKGFHLIHHSGVDLAKSIDGLYTRDEVITIMNTCFKRWDAIGRLIIVATPFIGFPQRTKRNEEQIIRYWKWLGDVLDMDKTVFITRKSTFTLRKNTGAERHEDVKFLKQWGKLNALTEAAEKEASRRKPRKKKNSHVEKRQVDDFPAVLYNEKFHAKFYAGIVGDEVEVLVGSYNVHEGKGLENLSFKRYPIEDFLAKYTDRLFPDVTLSIPVFKDTQIVSLLLDEHGKVSANGTNREKFLNEWF